MHFYALRKSPSAPFVRGAGFSRRVKASRSAAVSTLSTPPRRVLPQTTYRVECELHKWLAQNLKCDVAGRIVELEPDARGKEVVVASCMATMCNPAQIPGQGYD